MAKTSKPKKSTTITDYYPLTTCGDPPSPPSPPASAAPATPDRSPPLEEVPPPLRRSRRQPSKNLTWRLSAEGFPTKTSSPANRNERQNKAGDDVSAADGVEEHEVEDVTVPNANRLKVLLIIRRQLLSFKPIRNTEDGILKISSVCQHIRDMENLSYATVLYSGIIDGLVEYDEGLNTDMLLLVYQARERIQALYARKQIKAKLQKQILNEYLARMSAQENSGRIQSPEVDDDRNSGAKENEPSRDKQEGNTDSRHDSGQGGHDKGDGEGTAGPTSEKVSIRVPSLLSVCILLFCINPF